MRVNIGIDAVNDPTIPVKGGVITTIPTLFGNDTVNGIPFVATDVTLTTLPIGGGIIMNANGTITVPANAPSGNYPISYTICTVAKPSVCDTATMTVVVSAQIPSIAVIKTATAVDENGDGFATVGETIRYNFIITNTGNVPLSNITITDPLTGIVIKGGPITLMAGQQDSNSIYGIYTITQADANKGEVSNQAKVSGLSPLDIKVNDSSDNYSNFSDGYTILSIKNCVVTVNNAITPNGDGDNESFHIEGLECFKMNTVKIYNRWGVLVFEAEGYNNNDNVFDGHSRGRTTINQSEGLPDGTYFYVLEYVDFSGNGNKKAGYLYLKN